MNDLLIVKLKNGKIIQKIYSDCKEGFKGYTFINNSGQKAHTWDFEESIGE